MSPDNQTHALPLALMAILVLLGVAALGLLYYRKRQLQGTVEGQFKGFREKAVALMDPLDALRRRHETLPSIDPDFTESIWAWAAINATTWNSRCSGEGKPADRHSQGTVICKSPGGPAPRMRLV